MASGDVISCKAFTDYLVTQLPVYDKEIVKDIRPYDAGLMGYYVTGPFDAYSGVEHTFDRVNAVYPNVTKEWVNTTTGNCVGTPCDPVANQIGMGNQRFTYRLEQQSWESQLMCFDEQMTRTKAKESIAFYISDILRPATNWITNFYLTRKAMELSGRKLVVTTPVAGKLPEFAFTWDSGGYEYLNVTDANTGLPIDPTGLLTANILQREVYPQYLVGGNKAAKGGFEALQLHTDIDTFHYLAKEDPILLNAWRFGEFAPASKEFYAYGFTGYVGDYMVKTLMFPLRFNKVSTGRYQVVLPYVNVAATNGIRSIANPDYQAAQYQFSYINNPRSLRFMAFNPEAINPQMPYLVRSYGGQWRFATHDLGADCDGKPIANYRQNKGKWYADFRWAIKPEHPEWLVSFFHLRQPPCLTIVEPCQDDPGYPAQSYDSANAACDSVIEFTAIKDGSGNFVIAATGVTGDGNIVTLGSGISTATFSTFVSDLQTRWAAAGQTGTWTVVDATAFKFELSGGAYTDVAVTFVI